MFLLSRNKRIITVAFGVIGTRPKIIWRNNSPCGYRPVLWALADWSARKRVCFLVSLQRCINLYTVFGMLRLKFVNVTGQFIVYYFVWFIQFSQKALIALYIHIISIYICKRRYSPHLYNYIVYQWAFLSFFFII